MRLRACLLLSLIVATLQSAAALPYPTWPGHHMVKSFDGTKLSVYTETPLTLIPGKKFPLLVFVNSWSVPGIEYLVKTIQWASKGYICVEYAARGWYLSGGLIEAAGPPDVLDAKAIIDWALHQFPHANATAIGMAGISYGGILSQLTAAADARVRAVLAMSGMSDSDLDWQKSVSKAWGWLLVASGKIPFLGREDPIIGKEYNDLLAHRNVSGVTAWAANRSMMNVIEQVNSNRPAIYMSHQHQDNLFHSNIELKAWQSLQGPKKFDLNQGTHASAEVLGLLGINFYKTASNHLWGNALRWVDRWLKGIDNGVEKEPLVQIQLGGVGPRGSYLEFSDWPPTREDFVVQSLALGPRGNSSWGSLAADQGRAVAASDNISFSDNPKENPMTTGTVGISDLFKVLVPIKALLRQVDPRFGIVYRGPVQESPVRICGIPTLDGLHLTPSSSKFGLVVYLYDMDSSDVGSLITHGTRTLWPEDGAKAGRPVTLPSIEFHSACYELPQGHRLGLGINMYDVLYEPADKNASISIEYGAARAALHVPMIQGKVERAAAISV